MTFVWKDPIKFKSGIDKKVARNRRASARVAKNNDLRKQKLNELRQNRPHRKKSSHLITGEKSLE